MQHGDVEIVAVLLTSMLCSCAAPVYTGFESSPPGARIEINHGYVGRAPFTYKWPANMYSHFGSFADETLIRGPTHPALTSISKGSFLRAIVAAVALALLHL